MKIVLKPFVWLFFMMSLNTVVWAQSDTLFFDAFERASIGNQWQIIDDREPQSGPSNWQIANGELYQSSNIWSFADEARETKYHLGSKILTGAFNWKDYAVTAEVTSQDNDGIGIIFRYQNDNNYYRLLLMNDQNWAGLDERGNQINSPIQRLEKYVDGEPVVLAENRVSQAYPDGWFSMSIYVKGDSLYAFIDGEEILKAEDGDYTNGKTGFLTYANAGQKIDNVLISSSKTIYGPVDKTITYPVTQERAPYLQMGTQHSMGIAWRTLDTEIGEVRFGIDKDELTASVTEDKAVQKHFVTLEGLEMGQKYYYSVYSGGEMILEQSTFITAPSEEKEDVSFFVLGDSGVNTPTQYKVSEQMLAEYKNKIIDFILHVGDVHQGNGAEYDDIYFKPYKELIQELNLFTSIGNHDTYTDNAAPYLDSFYLFHNNEDSTERYYSFRWGKVFFIALDTNIDFAPGSAQYTFFLEQLQSEENQSANWTVVYSHHPPYSEYWIDYEGDLRARNILIPLYEQYGVDLVLNGHTHSYERGEMEHVHYLVTGGGGGNLDDFYMDHEHIKVSEKRHHFTRIDITGDVMRIQAIDEDGIVFDTDEVQQKFDTFVGREERLEKPSQIELFANYPNPFNAGTQIGYEVKEAGVIRLEVIDSTGRIVQNLVDKFQTSGSYQVDFRANKLASGVYTYRIQWNGHAVISRKMTLLK